MMLSCTTHIYYMVEIYENESEIFSIFKFIYFTKYFNIIHNNQILI